MLRCFCLQFWNFAVLSILHMPYLSPFFSVLLSWNRYVCLVPPHLQGPAIVCAVPLLSLALLVVPPFPKVAMMTLTFNDTPEISFFFLLIFCFRAVVTPQ